MKQSINLKSITIGIILMFCGRISYSQSTTQQVPFQVQLPASYYKGQEEKRKHAEYQNTAGTSTASSFYPQKVDKTSALNPEVKAKSMLNTNSIPPDFPSYKVNVMSEKEYELKVAKWFNANPTFRKK